MKKVILKVRVRPSRVAVLVAKTAPPDELLLAIEFLSSLWGGRYCPILPCDRDAADALSVFRLGQLRPDFVYGVGVDDAVWPDAVMNACQPRGYRPLTREFVEDPSDSDEEHITAAHVIHHLRTAPISRTMRERPVTLVGCDRSSRLYPFAATLFGIHYEGLRQEVLKHDSAWLSDEEEVAHYVKCHRQIVAGVKRIWLDIGSRGLVGRFILTAELPPTIVLVDSLVEDLALFWNLRAAAETDLPVWALPLPVSSAEDENVIIAVRDWLLDFTKFGRQSNFCRVISYSASDESLERFAGELKSQLSGSPIEYVDCWPAPNRLPAIVAFEQEQQLDATVSRRQLSFRTPRPRVMEGLGKGAWITDVVSDTAENRSLGEVYLPPRPPNLEILNAPCPPTISHRRLPRVAFGVDCINVWCKSGIEFTKLGVPTAEEVLGEILLEAGLTLTADEKRAGYEPVIGMLGGVEKAAMTLTGTRGAVLQELAKKRLRIDELQGRLKLGGSTVAELAFPESLEKVLSKLDPVSERIARRRFQEQREEALPPHPKLDSLLEYWADKGIVERQWQLGPCKLCKGSFWEPKLDISRPVRCPGCGARFPLPRKVPLGYSLHRLVRHAVDQGLIPVVLTARFLKRMTTHGFLWLPGVKYTRGEEAGDIDIVAACDGLLLFAECKNMAGVPADCSDWDEVHSKFLETVEVARACRADIVALAVLADEVPEKVAQQASDLCGDRLGLLLLSKNDLETGYREVGRLKRRLIFDDLTVDPMPDPPAPTFDAPRTVNTGFFEVTYGGGRAPE